MTNILKKIKTRTVLKKELDLLRKKGKKVVFTNGCFDLIHVGHIRYLKAAKKLGDILVIAINSDKSVRRIKGSSRPIYNQNERAEILASMEIVDYVVVFDEEDPIKIISYLLPDVLVKGGDWSINKVLGRDIVEAGGGKTVTINPVKGRSTSNILNTILKKYGNKYQNDGKI